MAAADERGSPASQAGGLIQPLFAGALAAIVGYASSFAIVLKGLESVGATVVQAASGLLAVTVGMGLLSIILSLRTRMPVKIAWSTPGAALLVASGVPDGGFPAAVGGFLIAGGLILIAGLWRPFARAVAAIPLSLASAMLAGVLLSLCLAPVKALQAMPALALPVILVWALTWRFARLYAVPAAVLAAALLILFVTPLPSGSMAQISPQVAFVAPAFTLGALMSIAVPLFIVTMASQNIPGLAVLNANGYRPDIPPLFVVTGLGSAASALFGGLSLNLAAITAALCAGPEAHPDPRKRYLAAIAAGVVYLLLGLGAGAATAFVAASPPLLIEAVAGLALLSSFGAALITALADEEERLAAVLTFITSASGLTLFGIGPAFWSLIAGGLFLMLVKPAAAKTA